MMTFAGLSTLRNFAINPWINGLILGIMVLGIFISFRVLNIADLSVEGIIPMTTMLTAVMIASGINPWLVLLISMILGAICGVLNAILMIHLKIPPLLSGIIVMALTFGIAIMINSLKSGQAVFDPNTNLTCFNWLQSLLAGNSDNRVWRFYAANLSYIIVALVVLAILFATLYFFFGTELGMSIRAAGKNPSMAEANGINVKKMSTIALAISGALIGAAGCLYGQHNGFGLPNDGQGMIVIALSGLFLGEIIIPNITFKRSIISCIVGSLLYWYVIQALIILDSKGYMLSVYKALLLIIILILHRVSAFLRRKYPPKKKAIKGASNEDAPIPEGPKPIVEELSRLCLGRRSNA